MSRRGRAAARTALSGLLAQATVLGARFRLAGAGIEADGIDALPDALQVALTADLPALWVHLGGAAADQPSLEMADYLGIDIQLVETMAEARAAVRQIIRQLRLGPGHLAIDIETAGVERSWLQLTKSGKPHQRPPKLTDETPLDPLRGRIACVQLCADGHTAFLFRGAALELVVRSHWLRRQILVAHNAGFEAAFLKAYAPYSPPPGRRPRGKLHCTMQAAGLLRGVWQRGLDDTCVAYLGVQLPKGLQTSDWGAEILSPGQCAYAALDAVVTHRLWPILEGELQRTRRMGAYVLQAGAIPAVNAMELRGLGFDRAEHARQVEQWSRDLALARQQYLADTGQPPPSKPQQVRDWLQRTLSADELATWPRTEKSGALAITSGYLKRLAMRPGGKPVLDILAREKLLQCFGPKLADRLSPATARLHCRYNISGSKGGRFTANDPNLQQLPARMAPEFRRCIVADPGHMLVGCDWNQVELRAAAWISRDAALTEVYAKGRDLHQENAAALAGVPLDQVTAEQRKAAKAVSFGSLYGIGPAALAADAYASYGVTMSVEEAKQKLDAFFARFPQLAAWRNTNADIVRAQGFVRIGCGRVVEAAWEPYNQISFPQCCNLPIQGICADAMLRAIRLVHARFMAQRIRGGLVACVHDELLVEVVEDDAEPAAELLQQAMIEAFAITFPGAPLNGVAKAQIGRSWYDLK